MTRKAFLTLVAGALVAPLLPPAASVPVPEGKPHLQGATISAGCGDVLYKVRELTVHVGYNSCVTIGIGEGKLQLEAGQSIAFDKPIEKVRIHCHEGNCFYVWT